MFFVGFPKATQIISVSESVRAPSATSQMASAIAEAIRDRCDGYRGTMGSVAIHCSHLSDQRDDYEAPAEGSDIGIHKITQEYLLWYVIAAPTFV